MEILRYFLMFIEAVTCILLVGIILLQKPKGQGIGMAFGAGVGEALFGAQTGNVLTKTTVVLAVIFLLNTTILSLIGASSHRSAGGSSIADKIPGAKPVSSQPGPSGPGNAGLPAGGNPMEQMPAQVPTPGVQPAVPAAAPAAVPAQSGVVNPEIPQPASPATPSSSTGSEPAPAKK